MTTVKAPAHLQQRPLCGIRRWVSEGRQRAAEFVGSSIDGFLTCMRYYFENPQSRVGLLGAGSAQISALLFNKTIVFYIGTTWIWL